jgi:hypothetical protein
MGAKALIIATALAMPLIFSTVVNAASLNPEDKLPSQPTTLDDSECRAIWSESADRDKLSYDKATPFINDVQAADPDNDGYFDATEFMDACHNGFVQRVSRGSHMMLGRRAHKS